MAVSIQDVAYYLPQRIVTNDDLKKENPSWDMALLEKRVGVKQRHISLPNETALDLAVKAGEKLFQGQPQLKAMVDGIIFCTQSEDYIMPPNSCILHSHFDFPDNVFAIDFNLACSGYVYGLFLAQSFIRSHSAKNVLLFTADTYSKYIHEKDRSSRVLFGDGGSVSWLTDSSKKGIIDIVCSTSGKDHTAFIIPAGGCRQPRTPETSAPIVDKSGNVRTLENIHMDGAKIISFVNSKIPQQINEILARNNMTIADIDFFILHQASKLVLDYLKSALGIPDEKFFSNLADVGNTVSSSIPISIKTALETKKIKSGDRILVSGFGVGLSWATAIIEI